MIAALAGQKTEIDLKNIYVRNVRIVGSTLRSRTPQTKAQILSELVEKVFRKLKQGKLNQQSMLFYLYRKQKQHMIFYIRARMLVRLF